eukprot:COSAG02_NODE_76316_length_135_cov_9652.305556_1_plen_35_part_10
MVYLMSYAYVGGAITRLEAEEMGRIMQEAKRDCAK